MKTKTIEPADHLAWIREAEAALVAVKERRACVRRQLEWLHSERAAVQNLIARRTEWVASGAGQQPGACKETCDFWERNSHAHLHEWLRKIEDGGMSRPTTVTTTFHRDNGSVGTATIPTEEVLPGLAALDEQLAEAVRAVTAAEAALRAAKADARPALEADAEAKAHAFHDLQREEHALRIDIHAAQDVEEGLALRRRLDEMPLRLLATERAAVVSELALLALPDPASEREVTEAKAAITRDEELIREANIRLLAERAALQRILDAGTDGRQERNRLERRLAELAQEWREGIASRDVRRPMPERAPTLGINGNS